MKRVIYLGCDLLTVGTLVEFLGGTGVTSPVEVVDHIGKPVPIHSLEYEDQKLTIVLRELAE